MLGLLAIAPLIGLALLSYNRIDEANRHIDELGQLQTETVDLVDLVELQAALQSESFWTSTSAAVDELGIPTTLVETVTGVDVTAQQELAVRRTDALVAAVDMPDLDGQLAIARRQDFDPTSVDGPLDAIERTLVEVAVRENVGSVISLAAEQPEGANLVSLARNLEQANDVRSSFARLRSAFFANFDNQTVDEQAETILVTADRLALYEYQLRELNQLVPNDGALNLPLLSLITNADRIGVITAVEDTRDSFSASTDPVTAVDLTVDQLSPIASNFAQAEAAAQQHLDLVNTAAEFLTVEVEAQRAAARTSSTVTLAVSSLVALMTLASIITATRWIVRPLSDVGRTALALTSGGTGPLGPASGPTEIRLIHDALTEAISNLERTEQQAIALADGALDDPSLDQVVPGRFGATLHGAIEQLRDSISSQEAVSDQLAYEAGHDGLTGLANRRASLDFLENSLAQAEDHDTSHRTTVFFVDLDHFKEVNDIHGHAAGDDVLRTVAGALRGCARAGDMVGRIGGDEFLIVSKGTMTIEETTSLAERYLSAIKESLVYSTEIGASIGVAMSYAGAEVDTLLAEADIAMLEAKNQGRDAVRFFDAELRRRTLDEMTLSTNIRVGLEIGEFHLHYQPIVDSVSGNVLDYEALIRWDRPGVGRVQPDDYIPFAERSDLVIAIDRWVLETAAETIASDKLSGVGIAVNISGRHLATGDLYGDLTKVLARTGINPRFLTVEITESALLGDIDGAIETLSKIRETGVKVAIDDFGTGFTSLTHLRRLPADVLKIDQSFTSNLDNPDDANLVRLVIQTAHILRLDVVVEGVETNQQAQRVTMLGADQMQGYYFARPQSLEDILAERAQEPVTTHPTSSRR